MLLLLALLGCPAPQPGVADFPDLTGPSGSRALVLDPADAALVLDTPQIADLEAIGERWVLEVEPVPNKAGVPRALEVYRAKLPFTTPPRRQRPSGLTVRLDGEPLPFSKQKANVATTTSWRVNGKHLVLALPSPPEPGALEVQWPSAARTLQRRSATQSGLDPVDFVRDELTLDGITRHGITLPAGAQAAWTVTLPSQATWFDTWLAIPRAPLREPAPDPASLVVLVEHEGTVTEAGRQTVKRDVPGFRRFTADLSPWAGKSITLRIQVDPHENPAFDWIFAGSPTVRARPEGPVRRVVVLAMDTTRPDHIGFNGYERPSTPELDRIASQSVAFDRTWSVAPRTRPAFRSAFTGRLPLDAVGAPNLAEHLQERGWATAGIVANIHLQPRFDFDHGFDWWHYENNADAKGQVDRALRWLEVNSDRDAFLFVHFMDPHMPYAAPGAFKDQFVTDPDPKLPARYNHWTVNKWTARGVLSDQRKAHIEARHDGEMAYMSSQIGRFVDGLDALDGRTLLVIHTDHGEEFWEHGGFEHNHTLFDETTRAVLWFRPGGGLREGRRIAAPASLMDIAPTVGELLGIELEGLDGESLAPVLRAQTTSLDERPIPVGYLQYKKERWGVVWRDHKYILHTGTGKEELFDLVQDPTESADISADLDLQPWRQALAQAHAIDVRPGLRLHIDTVPSEPLAVNFPAPVLDAGVLDPETTIAHRANLEWGQQPKRVADDIGQVELSDDRRSLVYTPGPNAVDGVIWIQSQGPIDASAVQLSSAAGLRLVAGTVLVPPPGEASRMRALRGDQLVDDDEMEKLRALGYVEEDGHQGTDP